MALCNLLQIDPEGLDKRLDTAVLEGDYGNKIHVLTYVLKSQKEIDAFVQQLKEKLPNDHKNVLRQNFESFYNGDNKTLYLRLHKQLALQNIFRISQYDDIIHVGIKFTAYSKLSIDGEHPNILKFLLDTGIIA